MKLTPFAIILFVLCTTALHAQTTTKTITVAPYKRVTNGAFFSHLCLKSKESHAEYIDGFEFEWGYQYQLKINEIKLENPPEDAGDTDYKLVKLIKKEKVADDYTFELALVRDLYLSPGDDQVSNFNPINDSTYLYYEEINIIVPPSLQAEFDKVRLEGKYRRGRFEFAGDKTIRLIGFK